MSLTLIPGKPHPVTSEAETVSIIREVVGNEDRAPLPVRPKRVASRPARPVMERPKALRFAPLAAAEDAPKVKAQKVPRSMPRISLPIKRRHFLLIGFVAAVVFFPKVVVFSVLFSLLMVVMAFYIAGGEQIWRGVILGLHDLAERDPRRAARIRYRLDKLANTWDGILDKFPTGSVDSLYMPDFQALSLDEARNEVRLKERLERLREGC